MPALLPRDVEHGASERLVRLLLDLRATAEPALRDRILALDAGIADLDHTIEEREAAMNALVHRLYQLAPEEVSMVEGGWNCGRISP